MVDRAKIEATRVLPVPALVVEDEPLQQSRLLKLFFGLGYAESGLLVAGTLAEADRLMERHRFAFALVDLGLPDGSGAVLIARLRALAPEAGILVSTAWGTPQVMLEAIHAGASGIVHKELDDAEIVAALRCALRGGALADPVLARHLLGRHTRTLEGPDLDMLRHIADGLSYREVADRLRWPRHQVEQQVLAVFHRLHGMGEGEECA